MSVTYVGGTTTTKYKGLYHLELTVTPTGANTANIKVDFVREFPTGEKYWTVTRNHELRLWYMGAGEDDVKQHTISLTGTTISTPNQGPYQIYTAAITFNPRVIATDVSSENYIIAAQYYGKNINNPGEDYSFSAPADKFGNIKLPVAPSSNTWVYANGKWNQATAVYVYKDGGWKKSANNGMYVNNGTAWKS